MRLTLIELMIAIAFISQVWSELKVIAFPEPPEQTKSQSQPAPTSSTDEIQSDWK